MQASRFSANTNSPQNKKSSDISHPPPVHPETHYACPAIALQSPSCSIMSAPHSSSDVPLLIKSANSASERRVTPAWTISHFKTRLEPITGIPASAQKLTLRVGSQDAVPIEAADEESLQLHLFNLQAYAEIFVSQIMLSNACPFVWLPFSPILRPSQAVLAMDSRQMTLCHMPLPCSWLGSPCHNLPSLVRSLIGHATSSKPPTTLLGRTLPESRVVTYFLCSAP